LRSAQDRAADAPRCAASQTPTTRLAIGQGREGPAALPNDPGDVYADSAYRGQHFAAAVRARGGVPRVAVTSMWGQDETATLARLEAWNAPIQRVRARIEKIFGTWKRCYGLRRMRWRGIDRARAQVHFTATAYNLQRSLNLQPT
jgi:IS5 family transposase